MPPGPDRPLDLDQYHYVMWVQVYPSYRKSGGRHGYHAHQNSLISCVLYAQTDPVKTPIGFLDPRGAPVTRDYERVKAEFDGLQPTAPFHQPYFVFPEAGDVVCFPSWLIHFVPSHTGSNTTRIAFAFNLQENDAMDAWFLTAAAGN